MAYKKITNKTRGDKLRTTTTLHNGTKARSAGATVTGSIKTGKNSRQGTTTRYTKRKDGSTKTTTTHYRTWKDGNGYIHRESNSSSSRNTNKTDMAGFVILMGFIVLATIYKGVEYVLTSLSSLF